MSLVTYLMPGFALVYGALLLDEPITACGARGARADPRRRGARVGALRRATRARRPRSPADERHAAPGDAGRRALPRRARAHEEVAPFLAAVRAASAEDVAAEVERSAARAGGVRRDGRRGRRRARRHRDVGTGQPPIADRVGRRPRDRPELPRPRRRRRGGARAAAPPLRRARLPPAPDGDLRLQRAGAPPRRAGGLDPRGRPAQGVPAARRVGRRRPLRARRGGPGARRAEAR